MKEKRRRALDSSMQSSSVTSCSRGCLAVRPTRMCLDNGVGGHRSWQVRQPAAQSRLRSSARGAAPPALCLLVFGPWLFLMMGEGGRTSCACWCLGPGMGLGKMGWGALWWVVHKNGFFVYYNPPKMRCKEGFLGWVVHENGFSCTTRCFV